MSKTTNSLSSSLRSSLAGALLAGIMVSGGCGEPEASSSEETASTQQALLPKAPGADVWRANMGVTITATKDSVAKTITYVIDATNAGDDDARQVAMAAHFQSGVTVLSANSGAFDSCSVPASNALGDRYITCSLSSLGVHAKATLTVVVSNPTNAWSQASAQVFNITPDPLVGNNYAQLSVP